MSLQPSKPSVRQGRAGAGSPASGGLRSTSLGGVLVGALAIVLASAALGILVNHFSPRGIDRKSVV